MKNMIPITIMAGPSAFIASVRSPPNAVAPITPPPAATRTRRKVPHASLRNRRYSSREESNYSSLRRVAAVRRANHSRSGSPLWVVDVV